MTRVAAGAAWLFPITYLLHLAEEYFVGGGFPRWAERRLAVRLDATEFLAWNALAFVLMCIGAALAARHERFGWIEIALAIAIVGNAAAHGLATVVTGTYSPGLITSVFVWLPLGSIRLHVVLRRSSRRARQAGIWVGVAACAAPLAVP